MESLAIFNFFLENNTQKEKMISKAAFQFLSELSENNNRDWFNEHKPRYQEHYAALNEFVPQLIDEMSSFDEIESFKVYRIYRDVRFSKDKTPYKTSFSFSMTRATKLKRGGYYCHLEPGNTFIAGGFWGPNKEDLKRIREEIAIDAQPMRKVITDKTFVKTFGELTGDQVKSAPKGYKKDHPAIDLLRYKQFLVSKKLTDKEVHGKGFTIKLADVYSKMVPFFDYMSEVLTTNLNGELIV